MRWIQKCLSSPLHSLFAASGARYGVDPALLREVARQESGFQPLALAVPPTPPTPPGRTAPWPLAATAPGPTPAGAGLGDRCISRLRLWTARAPCLERARGARRASRGDPLAPANGGCLARGAAKRPNPGRCARP